MATLIIALGDERRGDLAAPNRVVELIGKRPGVSVQSVRSLSDSLARQLGPAEDVVFIDSSDVLGEPWVEPVSPSGPNQTSQIVKLARRLFNFQGHAYACHVPGIDFEPDTRLSPYAESRARTAAGLVRRLIGNQ